MPKEDYLIKFLEKLARVIAELIGLNQKGNNQESIKLADKIYTELFSKNSDELKKMTLNDFYLLIKSFNYSSSYLESLANITRITAQSFQLQNDTVGMHVFYQKSLLLYQLLNKKDKTFSFERELIISEIESLLSEQLKVELKQIEQ